MIPVTFKDQQSEINIMKSTNPVIQKRLGRHVQNFDLEVWKTKSVEVVKQATEAKVCYTCKKKRCNLFYSKHKFKALIKNTILKKKEYE